MRDVQDTAVHGEAGKGGEKDEIAEEVGVILLPDTVPDPRTVVVKPTTVILCKYLIHI